MSGEDDKRIGPDEEGMLHTPPPVVVEMALRAEGGNRREGGREGGKGRGCCMGFNLRGRLFEIKHLHQQTAWV